MPHLAMRPALAACTRAVLRRRQHALQALARPPPAAVLARRAAHTVAAASSPRGEAVTAAAAATASAATPASAGEALDDGRYDYQDVTIPRAPGVRDGEWREADVRLVRASAADALAWMARVVWRGDCTCARSRCLAASAAPSHCCVIHPLFVCVQVEAAALDGGAGVSALLAAAAAPVVDAALSDAAAPPPPLFLLGKSEAELVALAVADGQPAFRGRQLHAQLYAKTRLPASLDDLSTLPLAWRASLGARGVSLGRSTVHAVAAAPDGTAKLLLRLSDGRVVETVGIPSDDATKKRLTVCVSSQVGCPMRCTFCATGAGGFARNLGAHEIVDQVQHIETHFGRRASHVVFMGSACP
jgi:hypothetical protein